MKSKKYIYYAGCIGLGLFTSLQAHAVEFWDGKVKATGYLMQGWQSLEADAPARAAATDTSSGFNRLRVNLTFQAQISERISAYIELAEEPNDFEGAEFGQISQDLAFIDLQVNDWLVFRGGNIVNTLHNYIPFSDGAMVQGNPLIGNSPIDFITAEQGVQLVGTHQVGNGFVNSVGWDLALTNPRFFENFSADNPYQLFGKLRLGLINGFSLGGGVFWSDGSDGLNSVGGNTVPTPGAGKTSAIWFGDGDNYNFPGTPTNSRETHASTVPGIDVYMWQIDGKWQPESMPLMLRGWVGMAEDDWRFVNAGGTQTTFGLGAADVIQQKSEVVFFGVEGKYNFSDKLYTAVRYSYIDNESPGATGDTSLDRIQVGAGYRFNKATLGKVEYVRQNEGANSPGQIGGDWDGVSMEVSFVF